MAGRAGTKVIFTVSFPFFFVKSRFSPRSVIFLFPAVNELETSNDLFPSSICSPAMKNEESGSANSSIPPIGRRSIIGKEGVDDDDLTATVISLSLSLSDEHSTPARFLLKGRCAMFSAFEAKVKVLPVLPRFEIHSQVVSNQSKGIKLMSALLLSDKKFRQA